MPFVAIFDEEKENKFNQKFYDNRATVGIAIRPGRKPDTIRVVVVGKPPSRFGDKQGDHTFAWCAVTRCIEWYFQDVPLDAAVSKLNQFHQIFCTTFASSFKSCEDLMKHAQSIYEYLNSGNCPIRWICPWIAEYLTVYSYIHNFLSEAAALNKIKTGGRGEPKALEALMKLEDHLERANGLSEKIKNNTVSHRRDTTNKALSIAEDKLDIRNQIKESLSTLIDKRAIRGLIKSNDSSAQQIAVSQLIGINNLLQGLPNLYKLFLKGQNLLYTNASHISEELISDLAIIIFHMKGEKIVDSEHKDNKKIIKDALLWINKVIVSANSWSYTLH